MVSALRKVKDWRVEPDGLWSAPTPWVTSRDKCFRTLYADGIACPRARLPKGGAFFVAAPEEAPQGVDWAKWHYATSRDEFHRDSHG